MRDSRWSDDLADIDRAPDPERWVSMLRQMSRLDDQHLERLRRRFTRLSLQPGEPVLEVGCGAGGAARALARFSQGANPIVAVDPSQRAISEAERLSDAEPETLPVRYEVMDGRALRFPDRSFAVVHCSRVLIHAHNADLLLAEMVRVLRPGGRVLVVEPDRNATISDLPHEEVGRLYWTHKRSVNPFIGRQLDRLFREAGLENVTVVVESHVSTTPPTAASIDEVRVQIERRAGEWWDLVEAGLTTEQALRAYVDDLEVARQRGHLFRLNLEFCAYGQRHPLTRRSPEPGNSLLTRSRDLL